MRAMATRYRGWQARAVRRFHRWSLRRRWVAFALLPAVLVGGAGAVLGVPLTRLIAPTATASRGAASPTAAVTTYVAALNHGTEEDVLPVLDEERGDALIRQWRAYAAAMRRGRIGVSRLASRMPITRPVDERHAVVEMAAYPVWWAGDGSGPSRQGGAHVWRFTIREDHGWRIVSVTAFPWCGGYVPAEACA
jgi:hypothetical protein